MTMAEVTAASLCVLNYILAAVALGLCVSLFRKAKSVGWLFLGLLFIEPFYFLVLRALHGRHLLQYKTYSYPQPGTMEVHLNYDAPLLYISAVIGLLLLRRAYTLRGKS